MPFDYKLSQIGQRASHATRATRPRASRRSGERESVLGSPRGEAPRIGLEYPHYGINGLHQGRADRRHRVDRRLARHALLPVSRRRQGDQERRAAHRPRVAARAVRVPGRVRRHLRSRQAHAHHRQHPGADEAEVLEVRLQLPVQGGRLLRQRPALHRQQVGHLQPDHDARRRPRASCASARSARSTSGSSTRSCS